MEVWCGALSATQPLRRTATTPESRHTRLPNLAVDASETARRLAKQPLAPTSQTQYG